MVKIICGSVFLFFGLFNIYYAIASGFENPNSSVMAIALPLTIGGLLVYYGSRGRRKSVDEQGKI